MVFSGKVPVFLSVKEGGKQLDMGEVEQKRIKKIRKPRKVKQLKCTMERRNQTQSRPTRKEAGLDGNGLRLGGCSLGMQCAQPLISAVPLQKLKVASSKPTFTFTFGFSEEQQLLFSLITASKGEKWSLSSQVQHRFTVASKLKFFEAFCLFSWLLCDRGVVPLFGCSF